MQQAIQLVCRFINVSLAAEINVIDHQSDYVEGPSISQWHHLSHKNLKKKKEQEFLISSGVKSQSNNQMISQQERW